MKRSFDLVKAYTQAKNKMDDLIKKVSVGSSADTEFTIELPYNVRIILFASFRCKGDLFSIRVYLRLLKK